MVFLWIASKTYTKFRLCCATYIYRVCWRNTLSISALVIACTLRKIYYTATYQLCMHGHDICLSFQFLLSAIVVYWCGECFWSCCVSARWCSIWWSCSCWKLWLQFINGYLLRDACELLVTHVLIFFTVTHLPPQATIRYQAVNGSQVEVYCDTEGTNCGGEGGSLLCKTSSNLWCFLFRQNFRVYTCMDL